MWQKWRKHCGLYSLSAGTSTLKSLLGYGFVDTKSTAQMWGLETVYLLHSQGYLRNTTPRAGAVVVCLSLI